MILSRLGNKKKIAKEIQKHFPPHRLYIEPFFGAGGMFFNKPKAKYNMLNDLDGDVFNLFQLVMNQKEELEKAFYIMPIHSDLLDYWKNNKETEPIKKALRFLFLSNMTTNTTGDLRRNGFSKDKSVCLNSISNISDYLHESNARFWNEDFRVFIDRIMLRGDERPLQDNDTFIYCDPPYLGTANNYVSGFTENDSIDLFDCLVNKKVNFAV
jgi:DNA adenine methylase